MRLKKSYASYKDEFGNWVPQKDVEMHPLEEEMIRAEWALNEFQATFTAPTQQEEHEWMIAHGVEYVREKRAEHELKVKNAEQELTGLHEKFRGCEKKWHGHVHKCQKHALDVDIADTESLE